MDWGCKKSVSFAQLQKTLVKEAGKETRRVKEHYQKEVEKEERRIQEEAKIVEESIIDQARQEGERQAKSLHQEAQLKARAEVLLAKQQELGKVKEKAIETVLAWEDKKVTALIKALMGQLPAKKGTIMAGQKHEALVRQEARKKGLKMKEKTVAGDGGFVYSGRDIEINMLVSELVSQVFARRRTEIAKILFE